MTLKDSNVAVVVAVAVVFAFGCARVPRRLCRDDDGWYGGPDVDTDTTDPYATAEDPDYTDIVRDPHATIVDHYLNKQKRQDAKRSLQTQHQATLDDAGGEEGTMSFMDHFPRKVSNDDRVAVGMLNKKCMISVSITSTSPLVPDMPSTALAFTRGPNNERPPMNLRDYEPYVPCNQCSLTGYGGEETSVYPDYFWALAAGASENIVNRRKLKLESGTAQPFSLLAGMRRNGWFAHGAETTAYCWGVPIVAEGRRKRFRAPQYEVLCSCETMYRGTLEALYSEYEEEQRFKFRDLFSPYFWLGLSSPPSWWLW